MPAVSLYVPCYNAEAFVARAIEGILAQTAPPDEVLIVDDGSRDRTVEIASRYPVTILRHDGNRGLAAARNTGFRTARNDLVASLDADCVPQPEWLERLLPHLDEDRVVAAGGMLVETVLESIADRWRRAHMSQHWGPAPIRPQFVFGSNNVIRKTAVADVGWYDESLRTNCEDTDLSHRLRERGHEFAYEPSAIVHHLRSDSVRSILDAYWRWRNCRPGATRRSLRNVAGSFLRLHTRLAVKAARRDWRERDYELLWLDALLLVYLPYRDVRLWLRRA